MPSAIWNEHPPSRPLRPPARLTSRAHRAHLLLRQLWRARAEALCRRTAPRRFLFTFVSVFAAGILLIGAFGIYVNPWGTFGTTGSLELYNARLMKTRHLTALPPEEFPAALVLGSSNVMRFSPETIARLWNVTAFNYGVFWGGADDFLCISRYVLEELHRRPRLFIIGVDPWTLTTTAREHPVLPGLPRRLINTTQLARQHPDVNAVKLAWAHVVDLYSAQHIMASWDSWRDPRRPRRTMAPLLESGEFEASGMRTRYPNPERGLAGGNVFAQVESGEFPIEEALARQLADGEHGPAGIFYQLYDVTTLDEKRVGYLEEAVSICEQHGVRVALLINPIHPALREALIDRPGYRRGISLVHSELERLRRLHPNVGAVLDASNLESIGGDPRGFYDGIHPATRNCDLILARLAQEMPTLP